MNGVFLVIGFALSVFVFGYLVYVMIRAEKF
jgi:K+-transporting ATPase KdpF subunit